MNRVFLLAAAWIALLWPLPGRALDVIANESLTLTADEIRDTFLGEKLLVGTVKLVPVDNTSIQKEFLSKALQTDTDKYYARWSRKVYREGLTVPVAKGTDAEVTAFVKATPGAVGYVSKATRGVKILQSY